MKNKVRKFLPSHEGPYFLVALLDDVVYCIQKTPRAKAKVVHHDKLKPYHSRTPLANDWVFQVATSEPDFGPLDLWNASPDTEISGEAAPAGPDSLLPASAPTPSSDQPPLALLLNRSGMRLTHNMLQPGVIRVPLRTGRVKHPKCSVIGFITVTLSKSACSVNLMLNVMLRPCFDVVDVSRERVIWTLRSRHCLTKF